MEDTHGGNDRTRFSTVQRGLNPYYNGRYSWSLASAVYNDKLLVLILIIMEDTHGDDKLLCTN